MSIYIRLYSYCEGPTKALLPNFTHASSFTPSRVVIYHLSPYGAPIYLSPAYNHTIM